MTLTVEKNQAKQRKTRSDKGSKELTSRDIKTLRWIGEQRLVSVEHIAFLLGRFASPVPRQALKTGGTMRVINRWRELNLVNYSRLNELGYVWLKPKGMQLAGLDFDTREPSLYTVEHSSMVNHVRLYLEWCYEGLEWQSERQIRATNPNYVIPDAIVTLNHSNAIEIELTVKSKTRYPEILQSHYLNNAFSGVWYFVSDEAQAVVTNQVEKFEKQKGIKFVKITNLNEVKYDFSTRPS